MKKWVNSPLYCHRSFELN